jgi:hypothetical protein
MRKSIFPFISLLLILGFYSCSVQQSADIKIAFYNVENLFDTIDDPITNDAEFLPDGKQKWDLKKYTHKLDQISKVLSAIDTVNFPAIIGLCEVENRLVLEDLIKHPNLKEGNYSIIHKNSPDFRGIDNAIIYRSDLYTPTSNQWINVSFPFDTAYTTRDILYTQGVVYGTETIHLFVNHWTSRWGGAEASAPKRIHIAKIIKSYTDKILAEDPKANIIIMGDLNDNPTDVSIVEHLKAANIIDESQNTELYNLSTNMFLNGDGTLYYKSWDLFDQMIVSGNLLDSNLGLVLTSKEHDIFKPEWVLFTDNKGVKRPNRTASGSRYYGGFSDHLAVSLTLKKAN